jgi:hypothetical protein
LFALLIEAKRQTELAYQFNPGSVIDGVLR